MVKSPASIPSDLLAASQRFSQWRQTRTRRGRIPAELWELSVSLAKRHGNYRVSKELRLSYHNLKRRVESSSQSSASPGPSASSFVKLDLNPSISLPTCVIELQAANGSKMTIRHSSANPVDLIGLSRSFFGPVQ